MEKTFRKVKYTTLSPLHIGDGNTLGPLEYFVHNGRIYFYRSEDLNKILTEDGREDFINYAIEQQVPILQGFFEKYGGKGVLSAASKNASHSLSFLGGKTPNKVWTFIKSRNKPYIPGSEIKGAIRTAVLRKLILDGSIGDFIGEGIKDVKNRFSMPNPNKRELIKELSKFEERISNRALRLPQKNDAKFDFMKFLFVVDADGKDVNTVVAKIENKNTSKPGDYHEIVLESTKFQGDIAIANERQFQEFTKNFQADNQRKVFFTGFELMLKACYEMTKEILVEEINYFSKLKVNTVLIQLERIRKANTENAPVIRIGKHQGFMSITLAEIMKKLGDETYIDYVELLKSSGKRIDPNNFPKTRKVLVNLAKEELTLGWIKVEVE